MTEVSASPPRVPILGAAVVWTLDALLVLGWGWCAAVLVTGGWEWRWRFGLVRATTASAVIYAAAALTLLRYSLTTWLTKGREVGGVVAVQRRFDRLSASASRVLQELTPVTARRVVLAVMVLSTAARLLNAWHYWGFGFGDDVEIHEMTLSRVFGLDWSIWNIRTAVFPMVFIYPVQAVLFHLGVADPRLLVFAGRLVPIAFSAAAIWLTYRLALRESGSMGLAVVAATVLGVSKLFGSLGSTELPGTVAATLLLGAALLVEGGGSVCLLASSLFVGGAASFRFSELTFVGAGSLSLWAARRWRRGVAFAALSFAWFLLIVGVSDLMFWGKAFSSLSHAIDFTLVQRLSSRGFDPFHYYLSVTVAWADWVLVAFLVCGAVRAPLRLSAWFLVPVAALSCLPHREARYLAPAMPFAAILAAYGFWSLLFRRPGSLFPRVSDRHWRVLLVGGLCTLVLLEADGFRFRRSEAAIRAVSSVATREQAKVVALEDAWRAGGRLFLMKTPTVLQFPPEALASAEGLNRFLSQQQVDVVGLTGPTARRGGYADFLVQHGFTEEDQKLLRPTYRVFWRRGKATSPSS